MKRSVFLSLVFVLIFSASAFAGGFAIIEQSVSGLGNAFAGGAASAEDATTVYFNPAGLTRLEGQQIITAGHIIIPQADYTDSGSKTVLTTDLTGGDGGGGGEVGFIPNFYYSSKLNDQLSAGIGINAPYGLATDYDDTWVGRYHATRSELLTININPSIAYKIDKKLSLGFGLNAQYLKAELSNAIDVGTIDDTLLGNAFGGALSSQNNDGFVTLDGDSWAYGFNFGVLYEFTPESRAGLAYRSRMIHDVEGTADFSNVPVGVSAATGGWFVDTDVTSEASLPDTLSLSVYHRLDPKWAVMADVTWTNWSLFDELRFKFASGQPDGVTTENWDDSMRYSVGSTYSYSDQLDLRLGLAYDTSPIPDEVHRTPRIPGEDRFWVAFGAGYAYSDNVKFDLGYAHLFVQDPVINKTAVGEDQLRGALQGSYDASVDILSAQLSYSF